ncbi:hypothetical protein BC833DRAFT_599656, partial [Globomyces pollinis-pini]
MSENEDSPQNPPNPFAPPEITISIREPESDEDEEDDDVIDYTPPIIIPRRNSYRWGGNDPNQPQTGLASLTINRDNMSASSRRLSTILSPVEPDNESESSSSDEEMPPPPVNRFQGRRESVMIIPPGTASRRSSLRDDSSSLPRPIRGSTSFLRGLAMDQNSVSMHGSVTGQTSQVNNIDINIIEPETVKHEPFPTSNPFTNPGTFVSSSLLSNPHTSTNTSIRSDGVSGMTDSLRPEAARRSSLKGSITNPRLRALSTSRPRSDSSAKRPVLTFDKSAVDDSSTSKQVAKAVVDEEKPMKANIEKEVTRNVQVEEVEINAPKASTNPLIKYLSKKHEQFSEYYYEHVSYKKESTLFLMCLFPFVLLVSFLFLFDYFVFSNTSMALLYKFVLVTLGMAAMAATEAINQRHAFMGCMYKLISGTATIKTLHHTADGGGKSKLLHYGAFIFYCCLVAAELAFKKVHVVSPLEPGMFVGLDTSINFSNSTHATDIFYVASGSAITCSECLGLESGDYLIIPISLHLLSISQVTKSTSVISTHPQDLIGVTVNCMSTLNDYNVEDNSIEMILQNLVQGNQSAMADVIFAGTKKEGTTNRRCVISARSFRGIAKTEYSLVANVPKRKKIDEITPVDEFTCSDIGDSCLNEAESNDLSYSLLSRIFSKSTFNLDGKFLSNGKYFPFPSSSLSDYDYSNRIRKTVGSMLILAVSDHLNPKPFQAELSTDSIQLKLSIGFSLSILILTCSAFCILLSTFLIVRDLAKLRKATDSYLRYLSKSIQPGSKNVAQMSQYVLEVFDPADEDWDKVQVRFGEDRNTMDEPLGTLRFGSRKDVVKFKDTRAYY